MIPRRVKIKSRKIPIKKFSNIIVLIIFFYFFLDDKI